MKSKGFVRFLAGLVVVSVLIPVSLAWSLPKELYNVEIDREELYKNPSWTNFRGLMLQQRDEEQTAGMAYMISGGIAFLGGIVGYHNSNDVFAKGAYALAQSLGVAAYGYGAHLRSLGDDHRVLFETIERSPFLMGMQRDQFVRIYIQLEHQREKESQKIAALTHGLLAGLNVYNGAITKDEDLRSALYFIAAINLLASISYSF